jgi:hypothetical protein
MIIRLFILLPGIIIIYNKRKLLKILKLYILIFKERVYCCVLRNKGSIFNNRDPKTLQTQRRVLGTAIEFSFSEANIFVVRKESILQTVELITR